MEHNVKIVINWLFIISLLVTIFIINGCATIIHGTTQEVSITTDPSEATLCVDGRENYKSPAKITMKRKDDHIVEVAKEGFDKENINIKSVISGAVAGNLLLGGLIGIGVDAISGGASRLEPDNINVRLRPLSTQTTPIGAVARDSIEEKLDQLKKLKESEKITEDEYKKMRQEILASASKEKITGIQAEKENRPTKIPTTNEPPKDFPPVSDEKASSE
jgi:hypothetical protein